MTFTTGHLAMLGAVLGPLLTAIGVLFRSLLASKNDQIKSESEALTLALHNNDKLATGLAEATRELRELRADLWRQKRLGGGPEGSP